MSLNHESIKFLALLKVITYLKVMRVAKIINMTKKIIQTNNEIYAKKEKIKLDLMIRDKFLTSKRREKTVKELRKLKEIEIAKKYIDEHDLMNKTVMFDDSISFCKNEDLIDAELHLNMLKNGNIAIHKKINSEKSFENFNERIKEAEVMISINTEKIKDLYRNTNLNTLNHNHLSSIKVKKKSLKNSEKKIQNFMNYSDLIFKRKICDLNDYRSLCKELNSSIDNRKLEIKDDSKLILTENIESKQKKTSDDEIPKRLLNESNGIIFNTNYLYDDVVINEYKSLKAAKNAMKFIDLLLKRTIKHGEETITESSHYFEMGLDESNVSIIHNNGHDKEDRRHTIKEFLQEINPKLFSNEEHFIDKDIKYCDDVFSSIKLNRRRLSLIKTYHKPHFHNKFGLNFINDNNSNFNTNNLIKNLKLKDEENEKDFTDKNHILTLKKFKSMPDFKKIKLFVIDHISTDKSHNYFNDSFESIKINSEFKIESKKNYNRKKTLYTIKKHDISDMDEIFSSKIINVKEKVINKVPDFNVDSNQISNKEKSDVSYQSNSIMNSMDEISVDNRKNQYRNLLERIE